MREWAAETYHRVSDPMLALALPVLARLPLRGDEMVLDVGCGTGRVTELLLERLPTGRVLCVDMSSRMLDMARRHLSGRFERQVAFAVGDAAALPVSAAADVIFSTATFHWVLDHPALFRSLFAALRPGGRLVAQCGGGPNIKRLHGRCDALMQTALFAPYFAAWREPWEFADAATTTRRLLDAGFVEVRANVESTPVLQPDGAAYDEFVTNVICRPHLAYLPPGALRVAFVERLTEQAASDRPPYELDYWRLNLEGRKPE